MSWETISMLWKMTFTAEDILCVCEDEIHEDIEMNKDLKDDIEQWMANNSEEFVQKVMGVFQEIVAKNRSQEWLEGRPAGTFMCVSCGAVREGADMFFLGGDRDRPYCMGVHIGECIPPAEKESDFAPRRDL